MILYCGKHDIELALLDYEEDDLITVGKVREIINNLPTVGLPVSTILDQECPDCEYYDPEADNCTAFECFGLGCPKLPCEEQDIDGQ